MKRVAIIVSGGNGARMKSEIPKQFLLLNGKPIVINTLEKFHAADSNMTLFLVLNVDHINLWNKLILDYQFELPVTLVNGGNTRFHSVKNALKVIPKNCLVAIHDAVRPLIQSSTILKAFEAAEKHHSVVTAVPSKDSVRRLSDHGSQSIPREQIYLVQTPQVFDSTILQNAYKQEFRNEFTDDASVVEKSGNEIHIVLGDHENIKITYLEDLWLAERIISKR